MTNQKQREAERLFKADPENILARQRELIEMQRAGHNLPTNSVSFFYGCRGFKKGKLHLVIRRDGRDINSNLYYRTGCQSSLRAHPSSYSEILVNLEDIKNNEKRIRKLNPLSGKFVFSAELCKICLKSSAFKFILGEVLTKSHYNNDIPIELKTKYGYLEWYEKKIYQRRTELFMETPDFISGKKISPRNL